MMCAGGHYKEGGDVKQDKQMIKKAFKMHDDQLHEKKHTDLSKLKTGGKVKKMAEGKSTGEMSWDDIQKYVDEIPQRKAEAEQRMKDYKEGNAKSMAQFKENMGNIGKDYDSKIAEAKAKYQPSRVGGGGAGYVPGSKNPFDPDSPLNRKTGGKVKRGSVKRKK